MSYLPEMLDQLERALTPTHYCVDDMLDHGIGAWHVAVLLDNSENLSQLKPGAINDRDFAGHTALDIAYQLNRISLIETLEALGALGDKSFLESKGVGRQIENEKYVHLPGKLGKIKTLEKRHMEGGCLKLP